MVDKIIFSINIIGWGLVTDINISAEKLRWLGPQRYNITTLLHVITNKKRLAKLFLNGKEFNQKFSFIIACNTIHTGKGMKIAPKAKLDDGLLDLIVVPENDTHFCQWVFAAPANSPILKSIIDLSVERIRNCIKIKGEHMFTKLLEGVDKTLVRNLVILHTLVIAVSNYLVTIRFDLFPGAELPLFGSFPLAAAVFTFHDLKKL